MQTLLAMLTGKLTVGRSACTTDYVSKLPSWLPNIEGWTWTSTHNQRIGMPHCRTVGYLLQHIDPVQLCNTATLSKFSPLAISDEMCFKTDEHSALNSLSMELDAVGPITGKQKASLVRFFKSSSAELDGTASDEYVRKELCVSIIYLSMNLITFQSISILLSEISSKFTANTM